MKLQTQTQTQKQSRMAQLSRATKKQKLFIPTNINEKNITCKIQNFYILLAFLLVTIALLIPLSIYAI